MYKDDGEQEHGKVVLTCDAMSLITDKPYSFLEALEDLCKEYVDDMCDYTYHFTTKDVDRAVIADEKA